MVMAREPKSHKLLARSETSSDHTTQHCKNRRNPRKQLDNSTPATPQVTARGDGREVSRVPRSRGRVVDGEGDGRICSVEPRAGRRQRPFPPPSRAPNLEGRPWSSTMAAGNGTSFFFLSEEADEGRCVVRGQCSAIRRGQALNWGWSRE